MHGDQTFATSCVIPPGKYGRCRTFAPMVNACVVSADASKCGDMNDSQPTPTMSCGTGPTATILGSASRYCDGVSRRSFLTIGGLAMGGLTLSQLLQAESRT